MRYVLSIFRSMELSMSDIYYSIPRFFWYEGRESYMTKEFVQGIIFLFLEFHIL